MKNRTEKQMTTRKQRKRTRFGQWNVRTLYQAGSFAQLSAECERLNIDLIGLSEVRWNGSGEAQSENGGLLIYSGMPNDDDPHIRGVGIYMSKQLRGALISWNPISERIITARLKNRNKYITITQCYAPTEDSSQNQKDEFYSLLDNTLHNIPNKDITILMGDFNAQVGQNNTDYENVMGKHATGSCNENGELFIEICNNYNLKIGGSVFPHKSCHKYTWKSPAGNFLSQIDHICISRDYFNICCDVRNRRSADIGSDHYMLVAELRFDVWPKKKITQILKKYDVDKLHNEEIKNLFSERVDIINNNESQRNAIESSDSNWERIKTQFDSACKDVLGLQQKVPRKWITQESWNLISSRRQLKLQQLSTSDNAKSENLSARYNSISREVKNQLRRDKDAFHVQIATEAQVAANMGNMKELYKLTKELSTRRTNTKPLLGEDGTLKTSKEEQLAIWKKHFENTLNILHEENNDEIIIHRRHNVNRSISDNPPSVSEIRSAITTLKNGKAPGCDGLPAECFKTNPDAAASLLHKLFVQIWETEEIPNQWKESTIIKLPKKGNLSNCNNWRGISITPTVTKIFNKIILDRISEPLNKLIAPTQAGFLPHKSCIDQINTLRILIEQSVEFNTSLYITFIDFEKAFDALKREFIWNALEARGIPDKIIKLIKNSYEGCVSRVLHAGSLSEAFTTKSGVKQGCALSPLLFITALDIVFEATSCRQAGISWRLTDKLTELAYADDVALLAVRRDDMQNKVSSLSEEAIKVGLKINIAKSKCMSINPTANTNICLNGQDLQNVDEFEYLGSKVTTDGGARCDIESRIRKARNAFAMLNNIWRSNNIRLRTKILIFNSCVKTVLLYGCETWLVTNFTTNKIQTFMNRCLRTILRIWWPNTISNEQLWQKTKQAGIAKDIRLRKYGWLGHTLRKDPTDIPHAALSWNPQGTRSRGRPKITWKRTIHNETSKSINELRYIARNRNSWKDYINRICQ